MYYKFELNHFRVNGSSVVMTWVLFTPAARVAVHGPPYIVLYRALEPADKSRSVDMKSINYKILMFSLAFGEEIRENSVPRM